MGLECVPKARSPNGFMIRWDDRNYELCIIR